MNEDGIIQLAAASMNVDAVVALAKAKGGIAYCDERESARGLPFRALATVTTDDVESVLETGEVGAYVVYRRLKKRGVPNVIGLFPLRLTSTRSRAEADAHWRDVHGPLALEHHGFMSHYTQLSVLANLEGLALDGFALCGFDSELDLRNRFYSGPGSEEVIAADVRRFADLDNSPRRLVAIPHDFTPASS